MSMFFDINKVADFQWKILMSSDYKLCVTWFIFFYESFLGKDWIFFLNLYLWASPKSPILNRVKHLCLKLQILHKTGEKIFVNLFNFYVRIFNILLKICIWYVSTFYSHCMSLILYFFPFFIYRYQQN